MKKYYQTALLSGLLLLVPDARAADATNEPPPPPAMAEPQEQEANVPPALPENFEEQESLRTDVVIRKGKDKVVEEYRINGQLYMVRVIPTRGKPYYLRYPDGPNGRVIRRELEDIQTPYWKLFEW